MYSLFTNRIHRHDTRANFKPAQIALLSEPRSDFGFSLVEVTLAIGIISFCLLTMLGLLPAGLSALRDAGQETAQSQIVQQISNKAQLMPREDLDEYVSDAPYYFDETGLILDGNSPEARYEAALKLVKTVYPGHERALNLKESISTIRVDIKTLASRRISPHVIHVPNTKG